LIGGFEFGLCGALESGGQVGEDVVGLLGQIDTVKYMYIKRSLEGEINCR
jgi:hypothetical protein